jgi:hypothetical protein
MRKGDWRRNYLLGQELIFYPKFHCELNFIERFRCGVKFHARENCQSALPAAPYSVTGVAIYNYFFS